MRHFFTTVRLSLADLWHERVLTICLLLSVGAILGPLLLLFGLKYGIVETMRNRLLSDPTSREMFPLDKQKYYPYSEDWFTRIEQRPDVKFAIPRLDTSNDMTVFVSTGTEAPTFDVDDNATCIVSKPGDPRLAPYAVEAPGDGQILLSHPLAEKLDVREGATVTVFVDRGGVFSPYETVSTPFKVSAVLPPEATLSYQAWLALPFLVGVRDYKEGLPVPSLGWPGNLDDIEAEYDSVLTLSKVEPRERDLIEIANQPPRLVDTQIIDISQLKELSGLVIKEGAPIDPLVILWRGRGSRIRGVNLKELQSRLNEISISSIILPLVEPLSAEIQLPEKTSRHGRVKLKLHVLEESQFSRESKDEELIDIRNALESTWDESLFKRSIDPPIENLVNHSDPPPKLQEEPNEIVAIGSDSEFPEGTAKLIVNGLLGALEIPVSLSKRPGIPKNIGVVSAVLGGILCSAKGEAILYSKELNMFRKKSNDFNDFRLFAATLEDVAPLVKEFEDQGVPMRHNADKITKILELDSHLTRLFWLIASAAAGAGFFGLVASLFASVERKRRDLGVLQLLGLPKLYLFIFPVFQSAVFALGAFVLAFGLFRIFAHLINRQFASEFREGEAFCTLQNEHALLVLVTTLCFGLGASFLAAIRACRIQPSEALRAE